MTPGQLLGITLKTLGYNNSNLLLGRSLASKLSLQQAEKKIDTRTRNFVKTEERAQLVLDITQTLNIGFYEKLKFQNNRDPCTTDQGINILEL